MTTSAAVGIVLAHLDAYNSHDLDRSAHVRGRHSDLPAKKRGHAHPRPIDRQVDGREYVVAPAESLARLRMHVLDRVGRGEVTVAKARRERRVSRCHRGRRVGSGPLCVAQLARRGWPAG